MADFVPNGQASSSAVETREHEPDLSARRVTEIPLYMDTQYDYGSRTDGQPDYEGFGAPGLADNADGWLIYKNTYDINSFITKREARIGVWDDRASLF